MIQECLHLSTLDPIGFYFVGELQMYKRSFHFTFFSTQFCICFHLSSSPFPAAFIWFFLLLDCLSLILCLLLEGKKDYLAEEPELFSSDLCVGTLHTMWASLTFV